MAFDASPNDTCPQNHLDDIAVCRLVLRAAWECKDDLWEQDSDGLLGRIELDWDRAAYLNECGMARPLLSRFKGVKPPDFVPGFFLKALEARASEDALNDLLKREALRRIAGTLKEIGASGVLLKGSALLVSRGERRDLPAQRATGDLDLYVAPPASRVLRAKLVEKGFVQYNYEKKTAPHHLAPVIFRGMAVEIHERIMPRFWGLPERAMLAEQRPITGMEPLHTLSPEGLMLHAGIHVSSHLFSNGLKTAWDLTWISRRFPELDWKHLARLIESARLPRAFWTPVKSLAEELSLPLPEEFLRQAPNDPRQKKLENIARHLLFAAIEGPFDLNPMTKTAVFLTLHDSFLGRVRYLISLLGADAAESRAAADRHHPSQSLRHARRQFREARAQWRSYQRSFSD
jgi:hypothetical protein